MNFKCFLKKYRLLPGKPLNLFWSTVNLELCKRQISSLDNYKSSIPENILSSTVRILNKENAQNTQVRMDPLHTMDFELVNNNCSLIH